MGKRGKTPNPLAPGFISNLVHVFLDPAPSDVVQIHSPGTSVNTETHRLG